MSTGKYSPTINRSYDLDPDWWEKNGGGYGNGNDPNSAYDNDGYDMYGYNAEGKDRAGHEESDYSSSSAEDMAEYGDDSESLFYEVLNQSYTLQLGHLADYIGFGDVARKQIGQQCQYASRYVRTYAEELGYPYLGEGLRFLRQDDGNYHSIMIHKDDVEEFVRRYRAM